MAEYKMTPEWEQDEAFIHSALERADYDAEEREQLAGVVRMSYLYGYRSGFGRNNRLVGLQDSIIESQERLIDSWAKTSGFLAAFLVIAIGLLVFEWLT